MKKILVILFVLLASEAWSQFSFSETTCYTVDEQGNKTLVDCEDVLPTPLFTGNVDSLCSEMEQRFVETLNEWRRKHGKRELHYDFEMDSLLTVPWNEGQVIAVEISHGEGPTSLKNRSDRVGISAVGECCAHNYRHDKNGQSEFFIQYQKSPPHWKILTGDRYQYISVSVLYDSELNRYYSTVNVR